jgi:hypothetical protein
MDTPSNRGRRSTAFPFNKEGDCCAFPRPQRNKGLFFIGQNMKIKRILQNFRKSGRDEALGTADLTGHSTGAGGDLPHHLDQQHDHDDDEDDTSLYTTTNTRTTHNNSTQSSPPKPPSDDAALKFALFTEDKKKEEDRELSAFLREQAAETTSRSASFSLPEQKPPPNMKVRATTTGSVTPARHRPAPLHNIADLASPNTTASTNYATSLLEPQSPPNTQQLEQQFPPDRYAETRELVKKFIADIWNRGELELIPSVCSPSLRFNGNTGTWRTKLLWCWVVTTAAEEPVGGVVHGYSPLTHPRKNKLRLFFQGLIASVTTASRKSSRKLGILWMIIIARFIVSRYFATSR